jgi:ubiquinone/menaquinone biosynthesis C-methylase UbiE
MIGEKKITIKGGHFDGFKEEIEKSIETDDKFLSWFDTSTNKQESFYSGEWDFSYHIFSRIAKYINNPSQLTALEIGYGGGRLTVAASRYFSNIIGIDIHDQSEYVYDLIKQRNIDNIRLITLREKKFPVKNKSIDVIYSFIVFQHLESIEILDRYISECSRILKDDGICCIYFGRYAKFSDGKEEGIVGKALCLLDRFLEVVLLKRGYLELESKVNEKNIILSIKGLKKVLKKNNFSVIGRGISVKKIIEKGSKYGGQYGIVFKKNI